MVETENNSALTKETEVRSPGTGRARGRNTDAVEGQNECRLYSQGLLCPGRSQPARLPRAQQAF